MRMQIVKYLSHMVSTIETGDTGDDQLTKLLVFLAQYEAGKKTDADLVNVHENIYAAWEKAAEESPIGLLSKADILYAAELATRIKVDAEMVKNASIALAGANVKAKCTLRQVGTGETKALTGWDHTYFAAEKAWQTANKVTSAK